MDNCCTHIYYGNGKGKTTSAFGLLTRGAGNGLTVCVAQFLKDGTSGEIDIIKNIKGVSIITPPKTIKFTCNMTDTEHKEYAKYATKMLGCAVNTNCDIIILDEILDAITEGFLNESLVIDFLKNQSSRKEIVLTGHTVPRYILPYGDYITEFKCVNHPYNNGITARKGIEY